MKNLIKIHDNGEIPVSEVLLKCADILEEKGVAKGVLIAKSPLDTTPRGDPKYTNKIGSMCSVGVVDFVVTGNPQDYIKSRDSRFVLRKLAEALELVRNEPGDVVDWNNSQKQTAEGVIAGFRKAASIIALEEAITPS